MIQAFLEILGPSRIPKYKFYSWRHQLSKAFLLILLILVQISLLGQTNEANHAKNILYVKANSIDEGNGKSWQTAFNSLQKALDAANAKTEIWVAKGDYFPERETEAGDPRTKTFKLKKNLVLLGGFSGSEKTREERDWLNNSTTLNGDLKKNDDQGSNKEDNCYHVVTGNGTDSTAVIDGFIITNGNANAEAWPHDGGGGMSNVESSVSVNNCLFIQNRAFADGGGMRNWGLGSPRISNCIFQENMATQEGGGLMNGPESQPLVLNTLFTKNQAGEDGAGMYNNETQNQMVINCVFQDNTAGLTGAGMYNVNGSEPFVLNCTFTSNQAMNAGGAVSNRDSNPSIYNCILWDNIAPVNNEVNNLRSKPTISYSNIAGGYPGNYNIQMDPQFSNSGFELSPSSSCIDRGNTAIIPAFVKFDFSLHDRIVNDTVDLGAVEYAK